MSKTPFVFISYSQADAAIARRIATFCVAAKVGCFFDEWSIEFGQNIPSQVNFALEQCTHYLVLWSEAALKSRWVNQEWQATMHSIMSRRLGSTMIPILLDDTPLPPLLSPLKYLRYKGALDEDYQSVIRAILGEVRPASFVVTIFDIVAQIVADMGSVGEKAQSLEELMQLDTFATYMYFRSVEELGRCGLVTGAINFWLEQLTPAAINHECDQREVAWDEKRLGSPIKHRTKYWVVRSFLYRCSCGGESIKHVLRLADSNIDPLSG